MKRITFSLAVLFTLVSLMAFNWTAEEVSYDGLLDDKSASEMLFTTDSEALTTNLQQFLAAKLDHIDRVDAHYGVDKEYYFTAYGMKNGQARIQQVLVSEVMVCQQTFPTLEEMGLGAESMIVYCYWKIIEGPIPIASCQVANDGAICGVSPSGGLCVQIRIFPIGF